MKRIIYIGLFILLLQYSFSLQTLGRRATPIRHVMVLGNSFAWHPLDDFWWGTWGMAASTRDSDYCHVLIQRITAWQDFAPALTVHNITDWERSHNSILETRDVMKLFSGDEDLVVLRIGECVASSYAYQEDLELLLDSIRSHNPSVEIVVSGNFWLKAWREEAQENACKSRAGIWCPLKHLCTAENMATKEDKVFGDDSIWHQIKDGGFMAISVASHANNRGHRLMAEALFDSIRASWERIDGVESIPTEIPQIVSVEYFDLTGRHITQPQQNGIYIKRTRDASGKYTKKKILYNEAPY